MMGPVDPIEDRKRRLIQRLSGARRGASGPGARVGRMPGMFGRGMSFGGGNPGGLVQRISTYGNYGGPFVEDPGDFRGQAPAPHDSPAPSFAPQRYTPNPSVYRDNPPPPNIFGPGPSGGLHLPPPMVTQTPDLFQLIQRYGGVPGVKGNLFAQ